MSSYLLISYTNKSGQLSSITFKINIGSGKTQNIKDARKIADELTARVKGNFNVVEL
ncbi:hypothetical protein D3C76_1518320 [compost metagenome]